MSASAGSAPESQSLHGRVLAIDATREPATLRLTNEDGEITLELACELARALAPGALVRAALVPATSSARRPRAASIELVGVPALRADEAAEWAAPEWQAKRARLHERALLLATLRRYFESERFLEVETPSLLRAPGQEPHLKPFATRFHSGAGERPLWLATSPEYAMKRLLAIGFERLFQLGRAWRDGRDEFSPLHSPEFTLLEWYRAWEGLEAIARDVSELLARGARALTGATTIARDGRACDLAAPPRWLAVADAFRELARVDLEPYLDGDDAAFVRALPADIRTAGDEARARADSAFFKLLIERVEPQLGVERPTLLWRYPARHAALSVLDPADPRVARRFEVYVLGVEVGNAFDELRDADEQERRLREESTQRVREGGAALPIDVEFLRALRSGLPPCAGIALGVDRLHALIAGARGVADVIAFPFRGDV